MAGRIPPHDASLEDTFIGSMLVNSEQAYEAIRHVEARDFYAPRNARIFTAVRDLCERGVGPDLALIATEIRREGGEDPSIHLTSLMMNSVGRNFEAWGAEIRRYSAARELLVKLMTSVDEVYGGNDPYEIGSELERFVPSLGSGDFDPPVLYTMEELVNLPESAAPVIIEGMMDQDFRTLVIAEEGVGKSVVLRTIAMNAAQGFHPFSHRPIPPVRTLYIDLENPRKAIIQTGDPFDRFLASRSPHYDGDRFKIMREPAGIEIRRLGDRARIERAIALHRPQLVAIGPIYKMYHKGGNETYEDSADEAMHILDILRIKYGFALLLEHHAPKAPSGKKRELLPMGSQRWMAWPEIGIAMYKNERDPTMIDVKRFRGDRLSGVDWPDRIVRHPNWLVDGIWENPQNG